MTDPLYTSKAKIFKIEGVHRRASLDAGADVEFGVHGVIKKHYNLTSARDLPLPVDYVVAATGA